MQVVAVVPAYNEADRVGATVGALLGLSAVTRVLVVDDASSDATAAAAADAGATVHRLRKNRGKAGAIVEGVAALGDDVHVLLLVDADLGATATGIEPLLAPVLGGDVDLAIGNLPRLEGQSAGGFGMVVGLSRWGIRRTTGRRMEQPLSGQRCVRIDAFRAALPLARRFGVEAGMTIDVLRAGFTVAEYPIDVGHRVTGTSFRHQVHRARQLIDVAQALVPRLLRRLE